MSRYRILAPCCVVFALTFACAIGAQQHGKPAELIVGRWQGEGMTIAEDGKRIKKTYVEKFTFEYGKDGTFKQISEGIPELKKKEQTLTGKYSLLSETELELTAKVDDKDEKKRLKFTVTKDELTVMVGGRTEKFKRIK